MRHSSSRAGEHSEGASDWSLTRGRGVLGMIPWFDQDVNEVPQMDVALPFCAGPGI